MTRNPSALLTLALLCGATAAQELPPPQTPPPEPLPPPTATAGEFVWIRPYPYAASSPGYPTTDSPPGPPPGRWWSLRLSVDESNDFDGLNRLGGTLWLDTQSRWGLLTRWTWLDRRFDCGCHDDAVLGDANVTYRLIQHELLQVHAGLGFRVLADGWGSLWGVNVMAGADFFPVRPVVISTTFDAGTLGDAAVFHARATAGVLLRGWELFGGYDFLRIGFGNLQGPVVGLRLWF